MAEFVEVADRVWVAYYDWMGVNVTAVGSDRGLVVVDTHGSAAAGRRVLADLDRLGFGPVAHVVNSHWHWDHTFGNAAFREAAHQVPIHAHQEAARWLAEQGERMKRRFAESPDDPHRAEVEATDIVIPDQTFVDRRTLDLGDRLLELTYPGRGHTSGDIVAHVVDADVLVAGDLVEESAKPWIGLDSWPLDWAATLDVMLESMTENMIAIPGHGSPVDRTFVLRERNEMAQISETVRTLAALGVPAERAVAEGDWPWEPDFRIETLPSCVSATRPDRYPEPITADDYLQERLREIRLK